MNRRFGSIALLLLALALPTAAPAQEPEGSYPSKSVRIIVPYGAGGSTDVITRIVAQRLSDRLKQAVVVENKAGANSIIGSELVAKSPPDGYTFLAASNGNTVNVTLHKNLPFDFQKDLVPVVGLASMPNVIAVHPSQSIKTFQDLLKAAKDKPGAITYGHAGVGSSQHLSGELLNLQAKVNVRGIAYKGGGPAVTDALGNHVPMVVAGLPAIVQYVKGGQMRALAVTTPKRSAQLPDVPTVAELGYPGFDQAFWIALVAPRGTPAHVVAKMNREVNAVLAMPDVAAQIAAQGAEITGGSTAQLAKFIQDDIDTSAKIIREANIRADGS